MQTHFNSMKLFILILSFALSNAQIVFKPEKRKIVLGDSVMLSWKIKRLRKSSVASIKGLKTGIAKTGSIYVTPDTTTIYKIEILNKGKKERKSCKVKVIMPEVNEFRTLSGNNNDSDSTTIVWNIDSAVYVTINHRKEHFKPVDSVKILLDTTSVVVLRAFNRKDRFINRTLKVDIENVEYLMGDTAIFLRDTLFLKWQYKYSRYVTIDGINKRFTTKDDTLFIPEKDTTYNFSIYRNNGDTLKVQKHVKVKSPLIRFSVPKYIYKGITPFLTWEVKEGFSVLLNVAGDSIITNLKGSFPIPPDVKKKYSITVKDKNSVTVASATKSISRILSPVKEFKVPQNAIKEFPVKISWKLATGFTANIEDELYGIGKTGNITIKPFRDRKYKMVVYYRGMPVDTVERFMKVRPHRAFIKQIKDISELPANTKIKFEIFSIDESDYPDEVRLYLLAVDSLGNFVTGLESLNRRRKKKIIQDVFESSDKKFKKINSFNFKEVREQANLPYSISLSLDFSGSMYYYSDSLKSAVRTFINNKSDSDYVSVVRFNDVLSRLCGLESNKDSLFASVDSLKSPIGSTALYAGSDMAMRTLPFNHANKVLIIFTDGEENSSFNYFNNYAFTATQLAKNARANNVTIHVVGFGGGVNNRLLYQLAKITGGNFYSIDSSKKIEDIFKEFPIIFRNYYMISYKPVVPKGYNSVKIRYDNLQGKTISTQSNYQVGDIFQIDETLPNRETYWNKTARQLHKVPATTPQVVALFNFDDYELTDNSKKSIDTYINYLNEKPEMSAIIFGHTDSKGTDDYCNVLSEKRAEEVMHYMIEQGKIDKNRLIIRGFGKQYRVWEDDKEDWKAHENRRIEIVLVK